MGRLEAHIRQDGYYECEFIDERGRRVNFVGYTAEIAIAKVKKYIEGHGLGAGLRYAEESGPRYSNREKYGSRDRSVKHAQWGRPTKKQSDWRWGINQIFGEIKAKAIMAGTAGVAAANARITQQTAEYLLRRVHGLRGKYNVYTGNLDRAFKATIVQGRKSKIEVFLDDKDAPIGNMPEPSPRSGKQRVFIFKRNHNVGTIRENSYKFYMRRKKNSKAEPKTYGRVKYRYFKPWELKKGYRHRGFAADRNGNVSGFQYVAGGGYAKGTAQSGIILENTAPYAGAVAAKGYQVMPSGAILRSYNTKSKQQSQFMVITKDMLRAAKMI